MNITDIQIEALANIANTCEKFSTEVIVLYNEETGKAERIEYIMFKGEKTMSFFFTADDVRATLNKLEKVEETMFQELSLAHRIKPVLDYVQSPIDLEHPRIFSLIDPAHAVRVFNLTAAYTIA